MPDYKSMYYHLAGRMATSVEVLEMTVKALEGTTAALSDTTSALAELTEKLKQSQLITEEMFMTENDYDIAPVL